MKELPDWWRDEFRFKRYLQLSDLPKRTKGHCRWCGEAVTPPRRSWCSQECIDQYTVRSGMYIRKLVFQRDHGICAACGLDTEAIKPAVVQARKACPWRERDQFVALWEQWGPMPGKLITHGASLWDADHIVPVIEGGGCCGLDNLQTLCILCHKDETARLRRRIASGRRTQMELI